MPASWRCIPAGVFRFMPKDTTAVQSVFNLATRGYEQIRGLEGDQTRVVIETGLHDLHTNASVTVGVEVSAFSWQLSR
eukprot:m.11335 g.11335  ORF g.11335 m.11335 type:complete len:78 (+) comp8478_c0_seq1:24-257(+)